MMYQPHWYTRRISLILAASLMLPLTAQGKTLVLDIQAQELSHSITRLAQEAGISIGAPGRLLHGKTAPALSGNMSLQQALEILLENSGVAWQMRPDGSVALTAVPSPSVAQLNTATVIGQGVSVYGGQTRLSDEQLAATPSGNANLTDKLVQLPSVESQGMSRSSMGAGELRPENLSINGAHFYQNNFTVDGININNDLDPGRYGPGDFDRIGSHSQGLYVDVNSVASVEVNDHNVSASKGQFTGGTVDVETKRYDGDNHFGINWRHSSDKLTRYHYDKKDASAFKDGELSLFESTNPVQPRFKKNLYNLHAAFGMGGNWGTFVSVSRNESIIPFFDSRTRGFDVTPDGAIHVGDFIEAQDVKQWRRNDNVTAKISWQPDSQQILDIRLLYGTGKSRYQMGGVVGSDYTDDHHSMGLGIGYKNRLSFGQYSLDLDITKMGDERLSNNMYYAVISGLYSDRTEASGGPHALDNTQTNYSFKPKFQFDTVDIAGSQHSISSGLEINKKRMEASRPNTTLVHTFICMTGACNTPADLTYFSRAYYLPYEMDISQNEYAVWLEDNIKIGQLQIRPGMRADYNSFLRNIDISPRLSMNYDVFGNQKTNIKAGYNRYYGRSFLHLQAKPYYDSNTVSILYPGVLDIVTKSQVDLDSINRLKTPYDDEKVLGVSQDLGLFRVSLTGINRKGKDQVNSFYDKQLNKTYFTNNAASETNTVTLELSTIQSINVAGLFFDVNAALKWMERKSNQINEGYGTSAAYDSTLGTGVDRTDKVIYQGKVINSKDLPVNSFGNPLRAQVSVFTSWPKYDLNMSNFFTWRDRYVALKRLSANGIDPSTNERLGVYIKEKYGRSHTWDMQLKWSPQVSGMQPYVQMDILNVMDDKNIGSTTSSQPVYDIGRQLWLEVGMNF